MPYAIGIDMGGTRVKALAVSPDGRVLARTSGDTGDTAPLFVGAVARTLATLMATQGSLPEAIGLAAPGLAAHDGRSIAALPNRLPGLEGLVWTDALRGVVDPALPPVVVLNDAHAALAGEAWIGAAAGCRDAVLLTLGTGVGGAILCDGRLLQGHIGRAGHIGHISLDPEGPPTITGMPGGLEIAIGNCSVADRSKGRFAETAALVAAHLDGDAEATAIWQRSIRDLACGIASAINVVDPEVVVIGGGIAKAGAALFDALAHELDRVEWRPLGSGVRLVPAQLGDEAGAIGAARYATVSASSTIAAAPVAGPAVAAPVLAGAAAAPPDDGPAARYLVAARRVTAVVATQLDAVATAADWFAATILAGRMVHVFGSGHSRILVEEMWPRYGSFPGFNPIVELSLTFHNLVVGANGQRQAMFLENVPGFADRILRNFDLSPVDSALIVSSSGGSVVPVEMAAGFRARGIRVVAIVSRQHADRSTPKDPQGRRLQDVADLVLDTGAPAGDAMVTIDGLDTPVSPGSTVGGALLVNMIKAEVADRLVQAGQPPRVLTASALIGSDASAAIFEAAYDEHARRLARLYAGLGGEQDGPRDQGRGTKDEG